MKTLARTAWDFVGIPFRLVLFDQKWLPRFGWTTLESERIDAVLPYLGGHLLDIGAGANTLVQSYGAKGLVSMALTGDGGLESLTPEDVRSPVGRFFSVDQVRALAVALGAKRGDLMLLVAGPAKTVNASLDALRREIASRLDLADPNSFSFLFVVDFPLLAWNEELGAWEPEHHMFTAPRAEDLPFLESEPGRVLAQHYDMVCNGQELGSGSIRIVQRELLARMMAMLQITADEAQNRFGHMLDAFEYGAPPHGGFGHGLDRIVALMAGERDIREVIAFPKTKSAADLMTGAPRPADREALETLRIDIKEVR